MRWRRAGLILACLGGLFIAWATLTPAANPLQARLTPLLCLVCGDHGGADVGANLLLFVPLAAGLRLAGVSWRRVVLASALLSLTVELLQYCVIPGRDASLSDVLTNTTGGAVGAALAPEAVAALRPQPTRARRLFLAGAAAWLATMAMSAWLLAPAVLKGRLISNWADPSAGWDVFTGVVDSVRLNGREMPADDLAPDRDALRSELAEGTFRLEVIFRSGIPR
ncbi:MAG TPA: VanZ family protein, partial [Gemmatimonadales bacterium]|nr:VanZ family protein [Gemmatimonadales bacterium]